MAQVQGHQYHLVDPSPWPLIGSFGALTLALGFLAYLMGQSLLFTVPGFLIVAYTMYGWWRDVVKEVQAGHHTPVVQLHHRYGMALFIASEVMFFVAWFWAYFSNAFYPSQVEAVGGVWPPQGIETFDPWHLPFFNTLVLLLSGTTVTWAHHALLHNDRKGLNQGLALTVGLGLFFSALQAFEYSHATFGFKDGIYASVFYMATGFHGAHVVIGTIFLLVCLLRARAGHFTAQKHFGFESAAWYWHFVDVVWLFLFFFIYWWGAGAAAHG